MPAQCGHHPPCSHYHSTSPSAQNTLKMALSFTSWPFCSALTPTPAFIHTSQSLTDGKLPRAAVVEYKDRINHAYLQAPTPFCLCPYSPLLNLNHVVRVNLFTSLLFIRLQTLLGQIKKYLCLLFNSMSYLN